MTSIVCFLVRGLGHIIGEDGGKAHHKVNIRYPGLVIPVNSEGREAYYLQSIIPGFMKDPSTIARSFNVPAEDIIMKGDIDPDMENLYISWKAEQIRKWSGLIISGGPKRAQ